jgi:LPXTG-motif cell wall-anchored protein
VISSEATPSHLAATGSSLQLLWVGLLAVLLGTAVLGRRRLRTPGRGR